MRALKESGASSFLRLIYHRLPIPMSARERLKRFGLSMLTVCRWRVKKYFLRALSVFQAWRVKRLLHPAFSPGDKIVALQVDCFDKGGLEEVVLTLAMNLQHFRSVKVVVIVTGHTIGHLGNLAREQGVTVLTLDENPFLLRRLIRMWGVCLASLHYSTFGIAEYARANVPVVYTIHNTYVWADASFVRERSELYQQVSQFIAVSDPVRDYFASHFQIDRRRIITVPNGLHLDHVAECDSVTRSGIGLRDDDIVFLNVASFNWYKFHILMVAAMESLIPRLTSAKLVFVGNMHDPACRPYIEREILRRGLETHIKIVDYMPKSRVIGLMKQSDCFVLPSLIEGWSIAVMEAMYCELPLILSDVGSARSVITDGDIGIIIRNPYHDLRALTSTIVCNRYANDSHLDNLNDLVEAMETIGRNKDKWKRRAKDGRRKIEDTYTSMHMCQQYVSCFDRLMSKEKKPCS